MRARLHALDALRAILMLLGVVYRSAEASHIGDPARGVSPLLKSFDPDHGAPAGIKSLSASGSACLLIARFERYGGRESPRVRFRSFASSRTYFVRETWLDRMLNEPRRTA